MTEYVIGDFYNCIIVEINSSYIKISTEDTDEGFISIKDFAWNTLEKPSDKLFLGQEVSARYIGHYQEPDESSATLHFSLKDPDNKPYPNELYDLSCDELLDRILPEGTPHEFIGETKFVYRDDNEYPLVFLVNLISRDLTANLVDPYYARNLQAVFTPIRIEEVRPNTFYQVKLGLIEKDKRIARQQLYQFYIEEFTQVSNPYQQLTENVFKKQTSPSTNTSVANLLEEVGQNMYSSKERMFFELLQNADDSSSKEGVSVDVQMNDGMLLFMHNGLSLNRYDFESITSAAKSTKSLKKGKTGYKGIGFKSVFTNATEVYIQSSGFKFRFDKNYPMFENFDEFYRYVNECETEVEYQKKVLSKFATEAKDFKGVRDIPWQLLPIWSENMTPKFEGLEVRNMMIGIQMGGGVAEEYVESIKKILKRPEFLLFMRNTRRLSFSGLILSKQVLPNGIIVLQSYNSDRPAQYFKKKDFSDIEINNAAFEKENLPIEIREVTNNQGAKEKVFFDKRSGESMRNTIPDRIASAEYSTISFVAKTDKGSISPDSSKTQEYSSFFAYLPLNEKRFSLPFYVNADFVLTSDREKIQGENEWNQYLFANIGDRLVRWVASLATSGNKDYLNLLPSELFDEKSSDTSKLSLKFNDSYKKALSSTPFILNSKGNVVAYGEVVIDSSGLSQIIGEDCFCRILNTQKSLPSQSIEWKNLTKGIFSKMISSYKTEDVVNCSNYVKEVSSWLSGTTEEGKEQFINWALENVEKCSSKLDFLPFFTFGEEKLSAKDLAIKGNYIATNEIYKPIQVILNKLGILCSKENIDGFPLSKYLKFPSDSEYFTRIKKSISDNADSITLDPQEKVQLISALSQIDGVGDASIRELPLFRTCERGGVLRELKYLLPYREHTEEWLKPYTIDKEDNLPGVSKYLVKSENEFADIIWPHLSEIDMPYWELYAHYKWSDGKYTRDLIDRCATAEELANLLPIIEDSDKESKIKYLNKIDSIKLYDSEFYDKGSYQSKTLQLAIDVLDDPSTLADKIFYNDKSLAEMDVKDEVICEFSRSGQTFQPKLSLGDILPNYSNRTNSADAIKSLFEFKQGLGKLFVSRAKPLKEIFEELNQELGISDKFLTKWDATTGNASQYLFSIYYRKERFSYTRQVRLYSQNRGYYYEQRKESPSIPSIDFNEMPQEFVNRIFDFLSDNQIDFSTSPFTCNISTLLSNCYFNNDYLNEDERLLSCIELWADNEDKKAYLTKNGVKKAEGNAIKLRELFLLNQPVDFLDEISNTEAFAALKFLVGSKEMELPFSGINQKHILQNIKDRKNSGISDHWDAEKIEESAVEYDDSKYLTWKSPEKPSIFCFPGELPCYYEYDSKRIIDYQEGDTWYDEEKGIIYLNSITDINALLLKLAFDGNCGIDQEDYKTLCLEGTINVSEGELRKLKQDNERFRELLKKHGVSLDEYVDSPKERGLEAENEDLRSQIERMRMQLSDYQATDGFASSNPTTEQDKEFFEHIRQVSEEYAYELLVQSYGRNNVTWMNQTGESFNSYDYSVHTDDKKLFIDCKGTPGTKKTFYMSLYEWSFFLECMKRGDKFQIYRVFNVDSGMTCTIIDDLESWIKEEKIVPYLPATESIKGGRVFLTLT